MEYRALTTNQLLALMAVNYGPAQRHSDGRWRSAWKHFPAEGIADEDISALWKAALIEWAGTVAVTTESGRLTLGAGEWLKPFDAIPAKTGNQAAHLSIQ